MITYHNPIQHSAKYDNVEYTFELIGATGQVETSYRMPEAEAKALNDWAEEQGIASRWHWAFDGREA